MITNVLAAENLDKAARDVMRNKGSSGIDGMKTTELSDYIRAHLATILTEIHEHSYIPAPILGVSIPKGNGKTRLLGIPTVVDRWLQQAVNLQLMAKFEYEFEPTSYGFRPQKNIQKAVLQAQAYINSGYAEIVDIDLKGFFDEVDDCILLQLIYNKVKCPTTLRLLRKWLRAPILINGKFCKRRKGIPQGSPISPILSNIMLDVLDKEMKRKGLYYLRYADDFSIYAKTKREANRIETMVSHFLKEKLKLPINKAKSGIRRPVNFELLGHGFVPIYKKGLKGHYQLVIAKKSWGKLKRKLKSITKKTKPMSLLERLERLNDVCRGWMTNYRLTKIYAKVKKLDEWLRNRLRYCIWHDWKKLERKRKNLIRLGIEEGQAYFNLVNRPVRDPYAGWCVRRSGDFKSSPVYTIMCIIV
ncbi:group II intron reverse transcriptase/maturase [Flavivirga jejuensis]|uniref:RNA-directed DNA polymerase n=2 Tax=Flavivirga jejuensis TaxID=870487 RepID=A0ABT8WR95_9FLAO|nr:group II intron reverse transcriptase/maturase [Flavivirga jejuensis]MDO5975431.1 group II intron reverse transcriptase/maturase [Flavivirga jejuensis]